MPACSTPKLNLPSNELLDRELGRFFQCADIQARTSGELSMMPVGIVDARWHELIGTEVYTKLVHDCLGEGVSIEHLESGGVEVMNWIPIYERLFGQLNDIWFMFPDGTIDLPTQRAYRDGDYPKMSWDCTPGFVREDEADISA